MISLMRGHVVWMAEIAETQKTEPDLVRTFEENFKMVNSLIYLG